MNKSNINFIDVVNFLHNSKVTYDEAQELLQTTLIHIKQTRELTEYNDSNDYYGNNKCADIGNMIVDRVDYN